MENEPLPRVRGRILRARLSYLRRKAPMGAIDRVLGRLSAADQALLRSEIVESELYPFEVNQRLDAAIAEEVSPRDPDSVFRDMGRVSAEANLLGSQRWLITKGDCHRFLSQAPEVYRLYYDVGYRDYVKIADNEALIRTFDAENVTREDCLTVAGWYERALEMCGGCEVRVVDDQCRVRGDAFCQYRCEWR
jgi:uncharacterized protein (TIGR02265 family)